MTATTELDDLARNRFLQKKFLSGCGIPTAEFRLARNHRELVVAHQALGFPGVLKLQFSDDDAESRVVRDFDDVPPVLRELKGQPLIWERFFPADHVLRFVARREADGTLCVDPQPSAPASDYVATIGERLGIVGTYGVSMLESGERLLVDEISLA